MTTAKTSEEVLRFWYEEAGPGKWFEQDARFDSEIRERFGGTYEAASAGELFVWRGTADGRLAEVVVLDQFSRNMFRGSARAFQADAVALVLAQEAVRLGVHSDLGDWKAGILLPYMHSESKRIHEEALEHSLLRRVYADSCG